MQRGWPLAKQHGMRGIAPYGRKITYNMLWLAYTGNKDFHKLRSNGYSDKR